MIIPFEAALFIILGLAGWFQNRWLFLIFLTGELTIIIELIISILSVCRRQIKVRLYDGTVRVGRMPHVRLSVSDSPYYGHHVKIKARLTLPTGETRKIKYKAFVSDSDLSLPVPALSVGEMVFTVKSISFSDAAGLFIFHRKVDRSITIQVVSDPSLKNDIAPDDSEKKRLEKKVTREKGSVFARDEIRSFREYRNGDERRDIHWNISARFGKFYVKEYEGRDEEKVSGEERSNGKAVEKSDVSSPVSDIEFKKKELKSEIKKLKRGKKAKPTFFQRLTRAVICAGIVLIFLSQVTAIDPYIYFYTWEKWMIAAGCIAGTGLLYLLSKFRTFPLIVLGASTAMYVVRNQFKASDSEPVLAVAVCLAVVLAFLCTGLNGKENDRFYILKIVAAALTIVMGISFAGVLPQLLNDGASDRIASSKLLSGQVADAGMTRVYETENDVLNKVIRSGKLHYRVAFDGRVGQQPSQYTGETQIVVRSENKPTEDLYLRFFTGRKYKNADWYGGESEKLLSEIDDRLEKKTSDTADEEDTQLPISRMYQGDGIYLIMQETNGYVNINGYGMNLDSYKISNAVPEDYSGDIGQMSYNLANISAPVSLVYPGLVDATDVGSITANMTSIRISDCSDDISSVHEYADYRKQELLKDPTDDSSPDYYDGIVRMSEFASEYAKLYPDYYLQTPDKGIDKIRALVDDRPLKNAEDVTAYIRYILASHATYSLKARDPAGDVDPVEYFLFTSHRGHCEYYASAAALLYRLYGIPARYASGYHVSPSDFKNTGKDGFTAKVSDKKAHAWVEIYYPSTGWIPVEMTPAELPLNAPNDVTGYPTDPDITIWPGFTEGDLMDIQEKNGWTGRTFKDEQDEEETETTESTVKSGNSSDTSAQTQASADAADDIGDKSEKESHSLADLISEHRTGTVIFLIVIILIVSILTVRIITEYRFRHGGLMGIANRTDRIMAKSRDFAIPLDSQTAAELTAFFRLLDKAVYSGYIGTPEEIDGAFKTYEKLRQTVKEGAGRYELLHRRGKGRRLQRSHRR